MSKSRHVAVESRNESFVKKTRTTIWQEVPSEDNPYIAETCRCHGYDLIELMQNRSFVDVLFLLFRGELPQSGQSQLLEHLMIALINPGPRHPATRAAMNAGVGKTDSVHILPIALAVLGGEHLGAGNIEPAMRFLRKHSKKDASAVAQELLAVEKPDEGDWPIAPGFGSRYAGIDQLPNSIAEQLVKMPSAGKCLQWGQAFASALEADQMGWLFPGVAAAVFADLGFQPRMGPGLFQLLSAPGLYAHGIELANKPTTAMPFIQDENYVIET